MKKSLFILLLFIFGCSSAKVPFKVPSNIRPVPFHDYKSNPVKIIKIIDFLTVDFNLNNIPDGMPVDINLTQPVSLPVFFQMLITQNINIVGDINPENQKLISMPLFRGELRDLLKSVQLSHGLFFKYDNGALIVRETSPAFVKVIMPGTEKSLIKLLSSFGVQNSFYDTLSSRIVFKTDFYTYKIISDYFKNNGYLTLVYFDVMILETEENKDFEHGVDWSSLGLSLSEIGSLPLSAVLSPSNGSFSLNLSGDKFNIDSILYSLNSLSSFEVLQSARLSALNGSKCSLDVSEKIPYVSSISLSSISSSDDLTQSYNFDTVSSGLVLELKPTVSGNIISLSFDAKIQSVTEFLEVGTSDQLISQPVVSTKNLVNQIVFKAGETALIGGLKYVKGNFKKSSLSFSKNGFEINGKRNFYISIIIKSEVVRYVFT